MSRYSNRIEHWIASCHRGLLRKTFRLNFGDEICGPVLFGRNQRRPQQPIDMKYANNFGSAGIASLYSFSCQGCSAMRLWARLRIIRARRLKRRRIAADVFERLISPTNLQLRPIISFVAKTLMSDNQWDIIASLV